MRGVTEECRTGVEGGPPGGEAFAGEGGGEAFAGAAAMIESDFLAMQPTVFPNKSCCRGQCFLGWIDQQSLVFNPCANVFVNNMFSIQHCWFAAIVILSGFWFHDTF